MTLGAFGAMAMMASCIDASDDEDLGSQPSTLITDAGPDADADAGDARADAAFDAGFVTDGGYTDCSPAEAACMARARLTRWLIGRDPAP